MSDPKNDEEEKATFPHEAPNGASPEDVLAAMEAWGNGDPFADAVRGAAPGQQPREVLARRPGETEEQRIERAAQWAITGLNEE